MVLVDLNCVHDILVEVRPKTKTIIQRRQRDAVLAVAAFDF
jgi:hypothetical protein